jgi:amino acid adenylation domain-containing protein
MNTDNIEDLYPLAPLQRGLLFHSLYNPDRNAYFTQETWTLRGELNVTYLEDAWRQVVERHPVFRTSFVWEGVDEPLQLVYKRVSLPLIKHDWRAVSTAEQQQQLALWMEEDRRRPFDFSEAPLMRLILIQLAEDTHQFIWDYHHLLMDGWCRVTILNEVFAIYEGLCRGGPVRLDTPRPYRDYIAWLQEQNLSAVADYWKRYLHGFTAPTRLPLSAPARVTRQSQSAFASQHSALPIELTRELQQLARTHRLTVNTLVQGAWAILLSRYCQEDDVIFGTTVSGRPAELAGVEKMVGLFINTLPVRVRIEEERNVIEWLQQLQSEQVEQRQYEYSQLAEVQGWSEVPRGVPLFESLVVFENYPVKNLGAERRGNLEIRRAQTFEKPENPIELTAWLTSELWLQIDYDSYRIDAGFVARLLSQLQMLLQGMAIAPHSRLLELPLLTEAERQQILYQWNDTAAPFPEDQCLHQLFQSQVERTPEAIALVFENERLSYQELNRRANQLAHYLREKGAGPEILVGLLFERSLEMVVAMLAVLKSGAAYLPLDPAYPPERLDFMLEDAGIKLLLTQRQCVDDLPLHKVEYTCLDELWPALSAYETQNLECKTSPDNLAYVIYTSGSTGKPKGAMILHRAVVAHNFAIISRYDLNANDRVLQFASLSFDVAVEEIFPSWACGATVVIRPDHVLNSHRAFLEFLGEQRISVVNLSTPYWNEVMIELAQSPSLSTDNLRLAAIGGEKGLPEQFTFAQQQVGNGVRLLNVCGPTETTVTNIAYDFSPESAHTQTAGSVPLGRPITNNQFYILDTYLRPAPVGATGEIYISGDTLARGYLGRPSLTAVKFIPNPFSLRPGMRMYRSGDLGRYLPDGNIEFVERIDDQVKVRGFRVELSEIEAVLAQHPGVKESVAVVSEDSGTGKRIVAYVVANRELAEEQLPQIEIWPSVGEYQLYDELMYGAMTHDDLRSDKYRTAINRLVKDQTVVEIGTGKDAILARFAVAAGARKVYAIEVLDEAYTAARALVDNLGLSDKISLTHGFSKDIQLPEQVDVCLSEIIGTIGSSEGVVPVLNDARRFLKADGVSIPQRCLTMIAAVQLPDEVLQTPRFTTISVEYVESIFQQVGYKFDVRLCLRNLPRTALLSAGGVFEELDFNCYIEPAYTREIELTINRDGKLSGFVLWLNLHILEDVVIDNLEFEYNWLPVYLPVFDPPVEVSVGDTINAVCSASVSENGINPDYRVAGQLRKADGQVVEFAWYSPYRQPGYKQNGFYERLFSQAPAEPGNAGAKAISARSLRSYLSRSLPDYMIPSIFVLMDQLPLTRNGKVDRRALPAPDFTLAAPEKQFVAPEPGIEMLLADIWARVLGLERVSRNANFFELGGHSLLAMQVVSRIQEAFGIEFPLRRLFGGLTLADLAGLIVQEQIKQSSEGDVSQILSELNQLSDEQARTMLNSQAEAV